MMFVSLAYRLADHARQHGRPAIQRHVALAAPHDVFGLVPEASQLRPYAFSLVPDSDAAPGEAGDLQRVGGQRQLPPVGEQQHRRAVLEHACALRQPQVHPFQVRALVALVANEVGVQLRATALDVFLRRWLGPCRSGQATTGIRRISDQSVERIRFERGQDGQGVALQELVFHGESLLGFARGDRR
ncbi:hypothetical protein XAUB_04270 [Xanthomonas citri pv. aurantifolii str. ICPB 11122]|nr:hypothetical protein XAUB_04270 [Xanthomonas citri pv. aurantifolii str. ICPB 11122]